MRREAALATDMGMDMTVESLDHPVDNAPVRTLEHKGLTLEGYSRAAVQTYWRIPELKLAFEDDQELRAGSALDGYPPAGGQLDLVEVGQQGQERPLRPAAQVGSGAERGQARVVVPESSHHRSPSASRGMPVS